MRKRLFSASRIFAAVLVSAVLASALAGCRSREWYEERAVARAREFLLENAPELSTEQRAFVRYNLPVLLVAGIFGGSGAAISDAGQICPTWVIPGRDDAYMVFGVSDIRMESWYPNRLIRKRFKLEDKILASAVTAARKYVQNGLYYDISAHELNSVRFEQPKLYRTNFVFSLNPDGTADEKTVELRRQLTQFSLVWTPSGQQNSVVVNGLAKPDLSGFTVYSGGVMSPEYLKKHILPVERPRESLRKSSGGGKSGALPAAAASGLPEKK